MYIARMPENVEAKMTYQCMECGQPFEVIPGSRRRYCDTCITERVKAGKRLEPEPDNQGGKGSKETP